MNTSPIESAPSHPSGPVCTFPLALAVALMDCYFGGGPRHQDRPARNPTTAPNPAMGGGAPSASAAEPEVIRDPLEDQGPLTAVSVIPSSMKPKGFALRRLEQQQKQKKPPTAE
jgi:hypothetical protein